MAQISESFPDYEHPPVVETVLGAQFDRLPRLTNGHLGAFWTTLDRAEWPTVADAPALAPQFERFGTASGWATAIHVQLMQDPPCRLKIRSKDGNRMLQIQNGRLHFNWLGRSGAPYPRYHEIRAGFVAFLDHFRHFVAQENLGDFRPHQWEITYVNDIPQGTVWTTPLDWGFMGLLPAMTTIESIAEGESFGGQWHFIIPPQRGRLHIDWEHLKAPQAGDAGVPEIVRLTLTARGPIAPNGQETIIDGLDLGRATIVSSFEKLMSKEANTYWGLKHAGNC